MTDQKFYVVRWVLTDGERYLLWRDGGSEPDEYALVQDSSKILVARSSKELAQAARLNGFSVFESDAHVVDLRIVRSLLQSLRPGRPLSERSARVLLDAWNALEDLARSLGTSFVTNEVSQREEVKSVYEKLFYGNNLPAVTPQGSICRPLLNDCERAVLRTLLRSAMAQAESYIS